MDIQIVVALIALAASVLGGVIVAVVNHLFTRKKTEVEVKKLEAEIDKVKAETKRTLAEAEKISADTKHILGEVDYHDSTKINEILIYDGRKDFHSYDIISQWSGYDIQQGVIVIVDNAGLELRTYMYEGKETTFIPKNELVSGYRKLHASCELKVISASYEFSIFMMEDGNSDESIDDRVVTVSNVEWARTDFYFRAVPNRNYVVNILAERISGDGSLQVRNLVVTERIS